MKTNTCTERETYLRDFDVRMKEYKERHDESDRKRKEVETYLKEVDARMEGYEKRREERDREWKEEVRLQEERKAEYMSPFMASQDERIATHKMTNLDFIVGNNEYIRTDVLDEDKRHNNYGVCDAFEPAWRGMGLPTLVGKRDGTDKSNKYQCFYTPEGWNSLIQAMKDIDSFSDEDRRFLRMEGRISSADREYYGTPTYSFPPIMGLSEFKKWTKGEVVIDPESDEPINSVYDLVISVSSIPEDRIVYRDAYQVVARIPLTQEEADRKNA